jgi:GT2 family glycosyltransferase
VVVADGTTAADEPRLAALATDDVEVVRTAQRLGHAAAVNAGVRRATGAMVILLDASVETTGDIVAPLAAPLRDPGVGVAGPWGFTSDDLRHFEDAPSGDVDAIGGYCLAFRRMDFVERGPLDERFVFYRNLDIWWSLVLRDEGEETPPRRAVAVDLPATRHEHRGWTSLPEGQRDRLSKRNFYRVLDRFGARRDLLISAPAATGSSRPGRP